MLNFFCTLSLRKDFSPGCSALSQGVGVAYRVCVLGSARVEQVADGDHAPGKKGRSDSEQGAVDPPSSVMLQDAHRRYAGDPIPSPSV